jgi:hypothetical protein
MVGAVHIDRAERGVLLKCYSFSLGPLTAVFQWSALHVTHIMSGIEVAGLAFGILPILVEVLKSYTTVRDKVRTIRRCTQVAEDVSAEFAVIRITFLNDVRWILHSIEDKQYAKNILEDVDDWRPMSRELNDQLNTVLQDSYNACFDIIKRSKVILEEMNDELKRFDILLVEKTQVSFSVPGV